MKKKRFREEQIGRILRDAEAKTIDQATRLWGLGTIYLSMEAPVWTGGDGRCTRVAVTAAGKYPPQEGLSRTRLGRGGDEGIAGKK